MVDVTIEEREEFPRAGVRARRFKRFERDLQAWLATPEGRFATWEAQRRIEAPAGLVTLARTQRTGP
jgi:hypothetical protein